MVSGMKLYPHRLDLHKKKFWVCFPCGAWVGAHSDGRPLGRLADAELRKAKMAAHAEFDPLWTSGVFSRSRAYAWLSGMMQIPKAQCHIAMFDVDQCKTVKALAKAYKQENFHG